MLCSSIRLFSFAFAKSEPGIDLTFLKSTPLIEYWILYPLVGSVPSLFVWYLITILSNLAASYVSPKSISKYVLAVSNLGEI